MAFLTNRLSFLFLLILLSSLQIHARDVKFFNKVPTNNDSNEKTTNVVTPNKEQEPNFLPENENNAYGVYGHETGQLPPSTTTTTEESYKTTTNPTTPTNSIPNTKYLPKNYNPMAYVSVPEDNTNHEINYMNSEFTANPTTNNNQYYDSDHYYRGDRTYDADKNYYYYYYNSDSTNYDNNNKNNNQYYIGKNTNDNNDDNQYYMSSSDTYNYNQYHNGHSDYNNNNNQLTTTNPANTKYYPYTNGRKSYYNNQEQRNPTNYNNYNGDNGYRVQQQGMSDSRLVENGKYFYDVNTEKYVRDRSYDNSREFTTSNNVYGNKNSYVNNELNNYNNNFVNYESEEQFQDEHDMP